MKNIEKRKRKGIIDEGKRKKRVKKKARNYEKIKKDRGIFKNEKN